MQDDRCLGTTEHHAVQKNMKLFERKTAGPSHAILLDRGQNFVVPKADLRIHELCARVKGQRRTCCMGLCPQSSNDQVIPTEDEVMDVPSQFLLSLNFQCKDLQSHILPIIICQQIKFKEAPAHTEIESERVTSQETDQAVKLSDTILQRCSRQAPSIVCFQFESCLGCTC